MKDAYRIRNWTRYQHYKKRNPPWVKMHYELLSSLDWVMADDLTRLLMLVCIMIASRHDGWVPMNPVYIQRVGNLQNTPDFTTLLQTGFFEDVQADASIAQASASKMLASSASNSASASASASVSEGDCQGGNAGPVPVENAVITIPLIPSHGEYAVTQSQIDEWEQLFPGVDVPQTLREIRAWNQANPTRRKTRRGALKHIVAWLTREQNKA